MISCEVLGVALASVRAVSYCGTSLAAHTRQLSAESHRSAGAGGEGGAEEGLLESVAGSSGCLAGYEGGWPSLSGDAHLCKQICAGCWI